jgi:hypothetical protein
MSDRKKCYRGGTGSACEEEETTGRYKAGKERQACRLLLDHFADELLRK